MSDDDAEILAQAVAGFSDEAQEMLQQFEDAMLVLESDPSDAESLNAAFRAAHTIKGTAGLFGFTRVVQFTHEAETLLEALRSGELVLSEPVVAVLLDSRDQISRLLAELSDAEPSPDTDALGLALVARLRALRGAPPPASAPAPAPALAHAVEHEATPDAPPCWHLSVRFGPDALRNGLDPLAFLRYLAKLGDASRIRLLSETIPALDSLDAEACHIGFELRLLSDSTSREELESVFEFALDDCDLRILPPGSPPADFEDLAQHRCGDAAEARAALFACWEALGLRFPLRIEPAAAPDAAEDDAPAAVPHIERRDPNAPSNRNDRRSGEGDRRNGGRDRRAGDETRFVRVRADKLDHLIDLIGELVIAGSGAQMVAHLEQSTPLLEAAERVMTLVQDTRDAALGLRMVPIGETFGRFHRVVRDLSKQLGKDIELVVSGGDTELDKSMVEQIADPLMHLVRNSLDHGIELAADRIAAGKAATGRLTLNAYQKAGAIVIEVADDGKGLARERILAKALERGLVQPGQTLSDHEVWQLIFLPGFSTADAVTDISGRGVGMDVVKRNIESLRGTIQLSSETGHGTTTRINLPLTLAMIDGFLTLVGGVHYVLPLASVSECIDVPPEHDDSRRVSGTFNLRGEVLPWLDLARFYGVEPTPLTASSRRSVVVVRHADQRVGLVVDRLMGEHQTVIKPLSSIFEHLKALAGSTILGSGDVALVLDIGGLLAHAQALDAQSPSPHHGQLAKERPC
ncbi:chemotaxis protein CheA [Roseateles paludis]|uniref:Chemotaxis protein CheA n=1 Tax=Roseateles paludis TaxID=3145238 RepID=A0ABV0G2J2_9BURK